MSRLIHWGTLLVLFLLAGIVAMLPLQSIAQDTPIFATNTPPPPDPLDVSIQGPLEEYALPFWSEGALIELLTSQLERLIDGDDEQRDAIRLTQYELRTRFPGAPSQLDQRRRLQNLMLAAPRGSVDLRDIVRPYIISELNNRSEEFTPEIENTFTVDNFLIQTIPLNLNGDDHMDALIALRYPADAVTTGETRYEDFFAAQGTPGNGYLLVAASPQIPAAPYAAINDVNLLRAGDINDNGADEIVISVDSGTLNKELLIYGWRVDQVATLVEPGERILYGEVTFLDEAATIAVQNYNQQSPQWNCVGEITVNWVFFANLYRPNIADNARYINFATPGCALLEAEPLYERPADQAIQLLNAILSNAEPGEPGYDRASVALAMFYLLDGQRGAAEQIITGLVDQVEGNEWLSGQIDAFALAAGDTTNSPYEVCAALIAENPNGACNIDQALTQLFENTALLTDLDLPTQLGALGLPIQETVEVAQVGRASRIVVNFDLAGASWWSFGRMPMDPTQYQAEPTMPPINVVEPSAAVDFVQPPETTYTAFLNGNLTRALTTLENARSEANNAPYAPESLYIQALALDLTGNRQEARRAYFDLWQTFPATAWGQLAGAHLEFRGTPSAG